MQRVTLLVLLWLVPATTANAQALLIILFGDKLSTETFQMGINISGTGSNLNNVDDTKLRYSWGIGAFGEIRFSSKWYLQFDLTIKTPGGARDIPGLIPGEPILDSLFNDVQADLNTSYITLPILVKYRLGAFKLGLGPQFGYLTGASQVNSGKTLLGDDFTLNKNRKDDLNRWDAGVAASLDFYFNPKAEMRSMRLSLNYYRGLTEVLKDNTGDTVTNSILMLTLGIPIGGGDAADDAVDNE